MICRSPAVVLCVTVAGRSVAQVTAAMLPSTPVEMRTKFPRLVVQLMCFTAKLLRPVTS